MSGASDSDGLGSLVLGAAAGFGLLYLVTHFGLGGTGSGSSSSPPVDAQRLSFLMTTPVAAGQLAGFQMRGRAGLDPQVFSVDALIARVHAGGRADVELRTSGSVLQGAWESARTQVKQAGIAVWTPDAATTGDPPRGTSWWNWGAKQ